MPLSGALPALELAGESEPGSAAAGVSRVYYSSALSVVSQLRTNLPLMHDKVFPTSQVIPFAAPCDCDHTLDSHSYSG